MPVEARRGPENFEPSCHVGSGPLHAWQHWKPCRLVVTWQHRWHGNSVEEFNSAWTTDKVYGKKISQHCTTAKKMTRVYLLGTRTNSFCICCSILPENNFVLICFLMFYSQLKLFFLFFPFFFFMASGHASKSIPSCIFLFSNKINNLPRFENCLVFSVIMDP